MNNVIPAFIQQPQPQPHRKQIEVEICYLQKRIADNDGMLDVLKTQLAQLEAMYAQC